MQFMQHKPRARRVTALKAYEASGNGAIEPFANETIINLLGYLGDGDPMPVFA